jgi:hypothetical protein
MAKQYKVVVNAGKDIEKTVLDVPKNAGTQGKPLTIKAKAGHKYQLVETTDLGNGKQFAHGNSIQEIWGDDECSGCLRVNRDDSTDSIRENRLTGGHCLQLREFACARPCH